MYRPTSISPSTFFESFTKKSYWSFCARSLRTEKKLLEAATNLFASRGFEGTSIRDIARDMGMSISNIYYYFGSKESLLSAILNNNHERLMVALSNVLQQEKEPATRFKRLLRLHLQLAGEHPRETKIFSVNEDHLTPEGRKLNWQIQREMLGIYFKELKTLRKMGMVQCKSPTVTALNVLSVINWFPRWYRSDGKMSLKEVIDEIVDFVMHGILGDEVRKHKGH
jgi:AcrR family transcriptional regulator